jgi:hypothetical protein
LETFLPVLYDLNVAASSDVIKAGFKKALPSISGISQLPGGRQISYKSEKQNVNIMIVGDNEIHQLTILTCLIFDPEECVLLESDCLREPVVQRRCVLVSDWV